ncbi:HET-domain-containing protein [Hyaloscypha bicolor E]|uniref:HET-domain-containing protein n=1 Tax=Hyaloscypha bicolor E TaxID=1095630 RepID=A0A2J6TKJ4_9HELO|nr:HET-domain-containing protein [Hyaloscypha bicolor E]PMD63545.1 HET-domain-containing protein [Hyaloscypha bicolor E]
MAAPANIADSELTLNAPYQYQPIDPKDEIRILIVSPPASSDPTTIHGELFTAKRSDKPPYEALSYCWGAEVFPEMLHLPGGVLAITDNLAAALRQLRHPEQRRHLWVDAICINQRDNQEKNHQVSLMSQVFRNATTVLVWLGKGDENTREAMKTMKQLANSAWEYGIPSRVVTEDGLTGSVLATTKVASGFAQSNNGISKKIVGLSETIKFGSFEAYFDQDWFKRLWIIQEFVLAPNLTIHNGEMALSAHDFMLGFSVISLLVSHPTVGETCVARLGNVHLGFLVCMQKEQYWHGKGHNLVLLLDLYSQRQCKLEVDIVYGLLAIATDGAEWPVDYGLTVELVFTEVALSYLKRSNLSILHRGYRAMQISSNATTDAASYRAHLPSWVPDWRFEGHGNEFDSDGFNSATSSRPKVSTEYASSGIIGLEGVYVDELSITVPDTSNKSTPVPWDGPGVLNNFTQALAFKEIFIRRMQLRNWQYPTGEALDSVFAQSIILENTPDFCKWRLGEHLTPNDMLLLWQKVVDAFAPEDSTPPSGSQHDSNSVGPAGFDTELYSRVIKIARDDRKYIMTRSGYIGLAPETCKVGNVIAIFDGAETPFVLRLAEKTDSLERIRNLGSEVRENVGELWEIIGECYLYGLMNNEVLRPEWNDKRRSFWLV